MQCLGGVRNCGDRPIAWRDAAQVLNRIAQLIAGDGAVEINYKGAVMSGVDAKVASAVSCFLVKKKTACGVEGKSGGLV